MKGTRKVISGVLNSVDIFEDPISLNMDGDTGLTTSLGGFLSLLILIFIGVQAILQTIGMFTRDGPQIIQMNEFEDDPGLANLSNNNNFVMAIALTSNNVNVDFTVDAPLSFTSTFRRYIRSTDGVQNKIKSQIYWAPCTPANFPSSIFPENTFSTYSLSYAYCPTHIDFTDPNTGTCDDSIKAIYPDCLTPPDFNILGTFLSDNFEFIQFKLTPCSQSDSSHIASLKCASEEDINAVFNSSELTLNLYYSNTLIDPVNYDTPNKTYLDTVYWNVHPSVSTVADIFVDTETVQDFNNYFFSDEHTNRTFYSIQRESMRELQKFQATSLLEWNIRRSNLNHLTSRTYTKILDVISNVGGMSELFIIAGALIAAGYVRYKYQMILSNELYDFEPAEDKTPPLELPKDPEARFDLTNRFGIDTSTTRTLPKRKLFSQLMNSSFKKKKNINAYKTKSVKDYFELQKKKKRVLNYSEFSYFKAVLNPLICRKDPEEELAKKARKQVVQDLDIVKVVEKLKEIDKLKMLLLNSNQRKAFEFIEKPLITHEHEKPVLIGSTQNIDGLMNVALAGLSHNLVNPPSSDNSVSEYAKVYMAYRALQTDSEIENIKYNHKLLDMISEDLRSVFKKVDQFMGPVPNAKRFDEIVKKIMDQKDLGITLEDPLQTE